jgi:hypothetical protein
MRRQHRIYMMKDIQTALNQRILPYMLKPPRLVV